MSVAQYCLALSESVDLTLAYFSVQGDADRPAIERHLFSASSREVRVICLGSPGWGNVLRSLVHSHCATPLAVRKFCSRDALAWVSANRLSFDASVAYLVLMAPLADPIRQKSVVIAQDAVFNLLRKNTRLNFGIRRWFRALDWRMMKAFERRTYRRFAAITVISERERRYDVFPRDRTYVVANGVRVPDEGLPAAGSRTVAVFGSYDAPTNELGAWRVATEVLPLIRTKVEAGLRIIGHNPSERLRSLGRDVSGISVHADVVDPAVALRDCAVVMFAVPAATGVKTSVLDALAAGVAVIATSESLAGLRPEVADALIIADSSEDLAAAAIRLLEDPDAALAVGAAGRSAVMASYSWAQSAETLISLLAGAPFTQRG